jgi:hypothetical protein
MYANFDGQTTRRGDYYVRNQDGSSYPLSLPDKFHHEALLLEIFPTRNSFEHFTSKMLSEQWLLFNNEVVISISELHDPKKIDKTQYQKIIPSFYDYVLRKVSFEPHQKILKMLPIHKMSVYAGEAK